MIALVLVSLLAVGVLSSPIINQDLNEDWETFKSFYNRQYSMKEELYRRSIWEANLKVIQKHNREYDMNIHTYTLGGNEFADMTSEEFVSQMNGYIMNGTKKGIAFLPASNIGDEPTTVDWRTKGYVTEVKNQEQCGSCWAFSATGSLEGQHFKAKQELVSLSEQNLVDCSRAEGNEGCQGGLMDDAFNYIKKNGGIDTENSYPYKGKNGKCHYKASDVGATDTGFVDIPTGDESALKTAVATIGPISVAIDASHQSFQLYKSGIYNEKRCSRTKLDHGVLAVGYGTLNGEDYWLVKNSWGASWGVKGYLMMSRNANNQCGIATSASYPTL